MFFFGAFLTSQSSNIMIGLLWEYDIWAHYIIGPNFHFHLLIMSWPTGLFIGIIGPLIPFLSLSL